MVTDYEVRRYGRTFPGMAFVALPYGRRPYPLTLDRAAAIIEASALPAVERSVDAMLEAALDAPIAADRVEQLVRSGDRVTVVVSDATRDEPRAAFLSALRSRLSNVRLTLAIATGTHGPCGLGALGLPAALVDGMAVVDHDGHRGDDLVVVGTTARGTPVRLHRCAVEADVVVATGCLRPHYFAGFGAGIKAIFPGLGAAPEIRINHRLKGAPGARAGVVDGNPCRDDLEEAAAMLPGQLFLLNGICGPDGGVRDAVAGHVILAFREAARRATPWFHVRAPRSPVVVASDVLPVTASLYQASKILAAVAALVEPGGAVVIAAECPDGIGPLDVVNRAIFELGIAPRLPPDCVIYLVSALDAAAVAPSYARWAPSVEDVLARHPGAPVVLPRASQLLVEAS
jgi:nickel-dependent lactate racemase